MVGVAVNVTLVPEHIVVDDAAILTLAGKFGFTVIVIPELVAVVAVLQNSVEVITTVTISVLAKVVDVNVAELVPTFVPFNIHWYDGVPPLVGVAVNVTLVPAQMVVADAATLTLGVSKGSTIIVTVFDVAGEPVAHVAVEVISTVTVFPLAKVLLLYVALLVPTLLPFSFHW